MLVRKQDSGFLSFFKNTEMFLACAFVPLPGAVGRSEFSLGYLLQLLVYMPLWKACCLLLAYLETRLFSSNPDFLEFR